MTHEVPLPEDALDATAAKQANNGSQSYQTGTGRSERMRASRRDRFLAELGLNVSRWRKANRMTVTDLAESTGVQERVVMDLETGTGISSLADAMAVLMAVGIAGTVVVASNPYNSLSGTVRIEELLYEGGWPEPTSRPAGLPDDLFFDLVARNRDLRAVPDLWRTPGISGRSRRDRVDPRNAADVATTDAGAGMTAEERFVELIERQSELLPKARMIAVYSGEIFLRKIQAEFGFLTGADVAESTGSADPRYASDERRAGRLLALKRMNRWVYPGFQIADGSIRQAMEQLHTLGQEFGMSQRDVLVWLCVPTTFITGHRRPVEFLDDPVFVLRVAQATWGIVE
jgi:hypothetical protein